MERMRGKQGDVVLAARVRGGVRGGAGRRGMRVGIGLRGGACVGMLATALATACAVPDDDPLEGDAWRSGDEGGDGGVLIVPETNAQAGSEDGGGGRTGGDWIINGLSEPTVSGVNTAYALDSPEGLGSEGWLAEGDPDGAKVIQYLVECALEQGDSIEVVGPVETYEFWGHVGLAPEWKDGPCDTTCQQWVSACLIARTNETGEDVVIFVQGGHSSLGYGTDPEYPHYEGVFFGNVFDDPSQMYACRGTTSGTAAAVQQGRTCTVDDEKCGFTTFADCEDDAGCDLGPTGLATVDCQPTSGGPVYQGIAVHVSSP